MINIMLVDDEPQFVNYMNKIIEEIEGNYKVIYKTYDAQDALNNVKKYNPHVIFVDMKMSGKNGAYLVKEVKKTYPSIVCVIISGYKDFELAREAFRSEVDDYILKPVRKDQIKEILENVNNKVSNIQKDIEKNLITKLLSNKEVQPDIQNFFDSRFYYLLMIKNIKDININKELQDIEKLLNENDKYYILDNNIGSGQFILIGFKNAKLNINDIALKILQVKSIKMNNESIVVSPIFRDINDLSNMIEIMINYYDKTIIFGQAKICFLEKEFLKSNEQFYIEYKKNFETSIYNALWAHNWNYFQNIVLQAFEFCKKNSISNATIKKILYRITSAVEKNYNTYSKYIDLNIERYIEKLVDKNKSYNELSAEYFRFLIGVFEIENTNMNISDAELYILFEKYITDNFDKKITVESMCKNFYISSSKMNHIFKKYKNMTFVEYVNSVKIEKAKIILIEDKYISVKKLSNLLGFSDCYYFSKVFKKLTSYTPTQYKKIFG